MLSGAARSEKVHIKFKYTIITLGRSELSGVTFSSTSSKKNYRKTCHDLKDFPWSNFRNQQQTASGHLLVMHGFSHTTNAPQSKRKYI